MVLMGSPIRCDLDWKLFSNKLLFILFFLLKNLIYEKKIFLSLKLKDDLQLVYKISSFPIFLNNYIIIILIIHMGERKRAGSKKKKKLSSVKSMNS